MNNIHTLVIPDVHGRTFWKEAVNMLPRDIYPDIKIVFLGDYLDPYVLPDEHISRREAIENFKEIIEYAKSDDRVVLLIGNHDMHYFYDAPYKSRCDFANYNEIKGIFEENFDMFKLAYEETINGNKYFYTHAGVNSYWLTTVHDAAKFALKHYTDKNNKERAEFCKMLSTLDMNAEKFNMLLHDPQGHALLWICSYERGGDSNCGSCIWMDIAEWAYEEYIIDGVWQIFGHSLAYPTIDTAYVDENKQIAMLDSRNAWVIEDDGHIVNVNEIAVNKC